MAKSAGTKGSKPEEKRLEEMIEEATMDAYDEAEQAVGFFSMIEDNLELPFRTRVLDLDVDVVAVEQGEDNSVVAVCRHGRETQRIGLLDLPLPSRPPKGAEWIAAYRHWAKHK